VTTDHEDFEGLAAGFALHALEPDDEQRLAAHLLTCQSCARLVADTAALGTAFADFLPPEPPPAGLRDRILAAAAAEPRALTLPDDEVWPAPEASTPEAPAPDKSAPEALPPAAIEAAKTSSRRHLVRRGTGGAAGQAPRNRRSRLSGKVAVGVLAAAVGVGIAVPVTLAVADRSTATTSTTALAQWLLAPNAREVTLTGADSRSVGKAVVADGGMVVVAAGLPVNDRASSVYVLWAGDHQGVLRPVTTFDVRGGGPVQLTAGTLPFKTSDVGEVAISSEPGRTAPATPTKVLLRGTAA
jgi:hypothetical protein